MLLVEKQSHSKITNLLLGVLVRRDEVDSFKMTEINIPSEYINVEKLFG
jgi:hypothetical protein